MDVVDAQIQASTLPCASCLGLEGYVWCGKYQSPFAETWCDNTIAESVCETKIAKEIENCADIEYDPVNGKNLTEVKKTLSVEKQIENAVKLGFNLTEILNLIPKDNETFIEAIENL